jgi:hypothetical protein
MTNDTDALIEQIIKAARDLLQMREENRLPDNIDTRSAMQELSILIQWLDASKVKQKVHG